jgi:Ca2+-dependent lipid-binding protein
LNFNDTSQKLNANIESIGDLNIEVMSALLSRNTDIIGQMDPYVQIEIRKMKYKTRVLREAGLKPQWFESFVIPIVSL